MKIKVTITGTDGESRLTVEHDTDKEKTEYKPRFGLTGGIGGIEIENVKEETVKIYAKEGDIDQRLKRDLEEKQLKPLGILRKRNLEVDAIDLICIWQWAQYWKIEYKMGEGEEKIIERVLKEINE